MLKIKCGLFCLLIVLLMACNKQNDHPNEEPPKGTVTPVGTPDALPVATKTIGAEGGNLTSTDDSVTIIVPPGAFTGNQQVSIQRISNHCPSKMGMAYRLLPEGVTFSKPVTVKFRYKENDSTYFDPEYIFGAYQNKKGEWIAVHNSKRVDNGEFIAFETTHFSDWSIMGALCIEASPSIVLPNAASRLRIYCVNELLAPLTKGEETIITRTAFPAAQVKKWELIGRGQLQPSGNVADYTAPPLDPEKSIEGINVVVEIQPDDEKPHTTVLDIRIQVVHGFILYNFGTSLNTTIPGVVEEFRNTTGTKLYRIYEPNDGGVTRSAVVIIWNGKAGRFPIKSVGEDGLSISYWAGTDQFIGRYWDLDKKEYIDSPGYLNITSLGDKDGFVKGQFEALKCSKVGDRTSGVYYEILGTFMVREKK